MGYFKNTFSWSFSRNNLFHECKRKYYYNYYGYWDRWSKNQDKDSISRILYVLKNLDNRWSWKGKAIHREVAMVLKQLVSTGAV